MLTPAGTREDYGGKYLQLFSRCYNRFHVTDTGSYRMLSSPIITVLVGQSEHRFYIHQHLLCRHSHFFRHMLRSARFVESQDNVVRLPTDDVVSFAVFAEYAYVGNECDTGAVWRDVLNSHENVNNEHDDRAKPDSLGEEADSNHENKGVDGHDEENENGERENEIREGGNESRGKSESRGGASHQPAKPMNVDDPHDGCNYNAVYDKYDFMLQFTCYVLADKLQAPGFKRLIMAEIRWHGKFCKPTNVAMRHVQYVYNNTISRVDPLRRFCITMRCERMPLEETLEDSGFIELMEDGGPLVRDIMRACKKQALKQKQKLGEQNQKITMQGKDIADYEQKIKKHEAEIAEHKKSAETWKQLYHKSQPQPPAFGTSSTSSLFGHPASNPAPNFSLNFGRGTTQGRN